MNVVLRFLLFILMTPVFCCGFECGQIGSAGQHWASGTGISISTSTVRTDGRSLRSNPSAATAASSPVTAGSPTQTVIRFYLRFTTLPSADTYLCWQTPAGVPVGLAFKQSDSKLYPGQGSTITFGSTGIVVTTGQWYRIDLRIDQTTGTNNAKIDLQVDGTAATQLVFTAAGGSSTINVGSQKTVSGDWFYDDWIHSNTTADYPIGAGHVDNFVPTSDGTHTATSTNITKGTVAAPVGTAITSATTDAFNWVNAQPLLGGATDNTRLVNQQTASSAQYVEVKFGPGTGVSTPTAGPRAVEVITADREASTATCDFTAKINDNGTESTIIARGVVAGVVTDRFATKQFATAPTTGGAWNANSSGNAAFNNLKARWGYASDATPDLYWRGIMVEAEFADASGTTFTQNLGGSATPAGAIKKDVSVKKSGSTTPGGVANLTKFTSKPLAGSIAPAGAIAKLANKIVSGSSTTNGTLAALRLKTQSLAGSITPTAIVTKAVSIFRSGSSTATGSVTKADSKSLAGSTTPSGALATVKTLFRTLAGSITPSAVLAKLANKSVAGSSTPTGSLTRSDSKKLAGSTTPAGGIIKAVSIFKGGSITPSGVLLAIKLFAKFLTGSISPSAALKNAASIFKAGSTTSTGSLRKDVSIKKAGSFSPTGAIVNLKVALKALAASITPSGILTRSTSRRLAGSAALSGAIAKFVSVKKTAATAMTGALSTLRAPTLSVAGSVTPSGSVKRSALKSFASSIAPSGVLVRSISKRLTGAISIIGTFINSLLGTIISGDAEMVLTRSNRSTLQLIRNETAVFLTCSGRSEMDLLTGATMTIVPSGKALLCLEVVE
jgi:hypothetical protein